MEVDMRNSWKTVLIGSVVLAGVILGPACATKKMVIEQIATIDQKVEGVEASVEESQKRIKQHDERLASIGTLIGQHDSQFKTVDGKFATVDGKLEEIRQAARGKLIYQATLRNAEAKFKFDSYDLSPEIKAVIDVFVQKLIADNKGVYLEIQGHTDTTGPEEVNLLIGRKRAEAVMEYLYKQHRVPLHRMQVIGFGSVAPIGDNKTSEGRAMNRRVEILVYE
jgi:outer membrane protein OmpA-like peptidoglycan-associated protein